MLVYGKARHLLVALEHKVYWAVKFLNFDEKEAGRKRLLKLDELVEIRLGAYENVVIYKERTKRYNDKKLVKKEFHVGQQVFLYNSRLRLFPGKLKSRLCGPFILNKVFTNRVIEIKYLEDLRIFMVNGQRLKIYAEGERPPNKVSLVL